MDGVAEVLDGAFPATQDNRGRVVRSSPARLGVDPDEIEVLPHSLDQLVDVEPFLRGDRDAVRNLVQEVEFFNRDGVDLNVGLVNSCRNPRNEASCVPCLEPECNRLETADEGQVLVELT
jgi:hypothetical protein